ncbi:uncharacterized protein LOC131078213 [Cryptomeria japonica]|uniref:uncharacterized protein LOC131078213 n=1 Tax=Cryptomeria japonica TaxID=3369 RepID=UPI0027DA9787|nr:uncharacterized protein LOC131078213 [Cryptomeria japonica]
MDKCQLWEEISKILEDVRPALTIIVGDFNATLSYSDKHGGVRRMCKIQSDFQTFVDSNALYEVSAKGGNFTWTNRRLGFSNIAEKLDRFFLARDWNLARLVFEAKFLAISGSDHFLVSLVVQKDGVPLRCPFKVEKMWLREQGFREQKLKIWNMDVFGNIFDEKHKIEGELGALNSKVLVEGMDEVDYLMEKDLLSRYGEVLQREEIFWSQKSRENWLRVGDRNTKFFHSSMKVKRSLNKILSLRLMDGTLTEDLA